MLIEAGADVNASYNPLTVSKLLKDVRFLRNKIIRLDSGGRTPLHQAARQGHISLIRLLLQHGADPNLRDEYGRIPLHVAAGAGHFDVVELLVRKGSNADGLYIPASSLHEQALSAQKKKIDTTSSGGPKWPFGGYQISPRKCLACEKGHFAAVALLLEHGANLTLKGSNGYLPIELAADGGYDGVIELILNSRQAAELPENAYDKSLQVAARSGHEGAVRLLLQRGTQINLREEYNSATGVYSYPALSVATNTVATQYSNCC
jgi:ankyrin repeat protein